MPRWGMVIDLDKCGACQACTVACRMENNVNFAGPDQAARGRVITWNEVLVIPETEESGPRFVPRPCMHCDNPPCVQVCPVGATYRSDQGLVLQNYDRCIGCRYCTTACPYGARYFNWQDATPPAPMDSYRNPNVPVRPVGVVEKCTFCVQRIQEAEEQARAEGRPLRDGDVVPACVQTCPAGARYFGDLDDPESQVSRLSRGPRAMRLLEELGTRPKVYYLAEG